MKRKDITAAIRESERESTKARQSFERTGDRTFLDRVTEVEARIDRLVMLDPED